MLHSAVIRRNILTPPQQAILSFSAVAALGLFASSGAYAQTATLTTLYTFTGAQDGSFPSAFPIARDKAGNLFGTAGNTVYKIGPSGTETTIFTFSGDSGGEANGVILDNAGNLFGTAGGGPYATGVLFKLTPSGKETSRYRFQDTAKGYSPMSGLIGDAAGNLFGTAYAGGGMGDGSVFEFAPTGEYTVLHAFSGPPSDGKQPVQNLTVDPAGNIYGVCTYGGAGFVGNLFKIDANGTYSILYNFGPDGSNSPNSPVTIDSLGNLYGVAGGGTSGYGVVYKLSRSGAYSNLYNFTGDADGWEPQGKLALVESTGTLFGITSLGGNVSDMFPYGAGVVFAVNATNGKQTVLYSFTGLSDGAIPEAGFHSGIVSGNTYELFGTTTFGGLLGGCADLDGSMGCGTVFQLSVTP